ncbi:MAG: hypothetical protein ACLT3D_03425 [Lawsonibacter sp.]
MLAGQSLDLAQVRLVLQSVITQEYNYLLSWPISLVMRVLGTGRYVYLFAIANLYVLPALAGAGSPGPAGTPGRPAAGLRHPYAALHRAYRLCGRGGGGGRHLGLCDLHRPGAPSVGPRHPHRGPAHPLVSLLRRYFFFFTVSLGLASLAALAVRRSQWKSFAAMAASGVVCSLFFGQSFLVEQVLRSNYFDTYSAYDQGRWVDAVMLCRYFGWVLMAAALVCVVWCLLRRPAARYTALLTLAQPVLCLLLFTRVQSHGQQHLLLLSARPVRRPGPGAGGPARPQTRLGGGLGPGPVHAGQLPPPPAPARQPPGDRLPGPPAHLHLRPTPAERSGPVGGPAGVCGWTVRPGAKDSGGDRLLLRLQLQHL